MFKKFCDPIECFGHFHLPVEFLFIVLKRISGVAFFSESYNTISTFILQKFQ